MPIMAPKVTLPVAFGTLIGTYLFQILIPDEEFPILKEGVTALSEPLSLC